MFDKIFKDSVFGEAEKATAFKNGWVILAYNAETLVVRAKCADDNLYANGDYMYASDAMKSGIRYIVPSFKTYAEAVEAERNLPYGMHFQTLHNMIVTTEVAAKILG